jgi:hypothetical protein
MCVKIVHHAAQASQAARRRLKVVSAHGEDSGHARRINGCQEETQRTELDVGYDFIQEESAVSEAGKSVHDTSLAPVQPSLKVRPWSISSQQCIVLNHVHSSSIK